MKKLLIALVAAVAVSTVFARNTKQGFETDTTGFVAVGEGDGSDRAEYGAATKPSPVAGLFDTAGDYFLDLDTGDATLWATNSGDATFFDMNMQFNPCATAPEVESGTKIAVYLNTASNLVVISGPDVTTNVTSTTLNPGTWGRLTISATNDLFTVSLNGTVVGSYASLTGSATVQSIGFKGSGALDNYVARTTDPFLQNPAATVDGEGYATFAEAVEALADAPEGQKYVTLLDDIADPFTVTAVGSLAVKRNSHNLTVVGADGLVVGEPVEDPSTGITTYSAVEGVAALNGVWYASFAEAYSHASAQSDTLQVKIDGDFVPVFENPSANNTRTFETITFTTTNTAAENIAIATTDGHSVIKTGKWTFPQNATLTVSASMTVTSVTGGTLNIPAPIALTMSSYDSIAGIAGLTGDGVINAFNHGNFLLFPNDPLPVLLRKADWTGTLAIGSVFYAAGQSSVDWNPDNFGNTGSTIRFTGSAFDSFSAGTKSVNIELAGDGLSITGGVGRACELGGRLSGSGALTLSDNTGSLLLSGDVSGFTGNVTAAGTSSAITFGSSTTGNGQRIVVSAGESVTNAASATWTAANVIVLGELVANGTISLASGGKLWGDKGTGVYRANNSAAAIAVAPSWNGTYVIGWAGANGTAINFNSYGNSGSKIVVPEGSTLQGYIDVTANNTLTNNAEVVVNGVLNLSNGYNYSTVVWRKLSGSGTVKYAFAPTNWIKEKILELDRFTGSIEVSGTTQLEIESVNLSADAVANVRVVPIAVTSGGTVDGDVIVKVNGTENGQTLKYRADGLYVAIDIAIPAVDNMTASVTVDGVDTAIVDGGVAVASGARVVVTYTANEGYVGSGEVVIESASASSVVDTTGISATTAVAQVGETKYGSLAEAIDAVSSVGTVKLLANNLNVANKTLPEDTQITLDLNGYNIESQNTSGYLFVVPTNSAFTVTDTSASANGRIIAKKTSKTLIQVNGRFTLVAGVLDLTTISASNTASGFNIKNVNGVAEMVGGTVLGRIKAATGTLTMRGGTVDQIEADQGTEAVGPVITITGGTVNGNVYYKTAGGSITIPGTSTARFGQDQTTHCEAGYGTKLVDGWYVVAPMYAIKFISGEGSTTNDVATFEDDMPVAPTPAEVAGKAFSAWDPAIVAATAAATYTALYTNNVYTITLDANGGTVDPASISYTADTAAFDLPIATTTNDGVLFAGWTNETITVAFTNFVPGTTAALGDLTLYAKWDAIQPTDPWNTPASDAGVADALSTDGLVTESAAVTNVAGFNALVNYIETKLNVTAPGQMTANQKANAVLCYALNATTIPDTVIESVTIDATTQPDASGAMTLTVAIAGVTVGETVDAALLATVVSAKGGTALGSMSAENVTVSGCGAANGKVVITVTPNVATTGGSAPATFFTSAVITK